MRVLNALWPKRLFAQLAVLIAIALVLAQLASIGVLAWAHHHDAASSRDQFLLRRLSSVIELVDTAPASVQQQVLKVWQRPGLRVGFASQPPIGATSGRYALRLQRQLVHGLGDGYDGRIRVAVKADSNGRRARPLLQQPPPHRRLMVAVLLSDGRWLVARMKVANNGRLLNRWAVLTIVTSLLLVLLVVFWQVRRITKPMAQLATAANAHGRGQRVPPVVPSGPADTRDTINAFNNMTARIDSFVDDRSRMLAALSHDLRTPLTSMRLRLEMMADTPERRALLANVLDMQQLADETLAFMRDSQQQEPLQSIDISALITAVCDDLQASGANIQWQPPAIFPHTTLPNTQVMGRPVGLKRVFTNLLENACFYGERAQLSLSVGDASLGGSDKHLTITIDDTGPGIAPAQLAKVFEPFFRVERSRNRDNGGVGLGLSIAKTQVEAHGGTITASNRLDDNRSVVGLRICVSLPLHTA